MKKRIAFKPLETITFEMIPDGDGDTKEVDFTFNNYALTTIADEFGDINKLFKKYEKKPYDVAAILLYAGAKPNNADYTLEEARAMVASGGVDVLSEIMRVVIESLMVLGGDDAKKKFLIQLKQMKLV